MVLRASCLLLRFLRRKSDLWSHEAVLEPVRWIVLALVLVFAPLTLPIKALQQLDRALILGLISLQCLTVLVPNYPFVNDFDLCSEEET